MTKTKIPILDLAPETKELWSELTAAVEGVLRGGQYIMGPQVQAFEEEAAAYLGVKHAVGVNSGTDALVIALRAAGVGAGDEVITSSFTFFATAEAISQVGAVPVFADIEPLTMNLDPACVEAAVTEKTRAILPVHIFGQAAEMQELGEIARRHGLLIVEDVAQAFGGDYQGRKLGTLGAAGCYSFFPSKNLGAFGDGGLLTTDDDRIADAARMLRSHGSKEKYRNEILGYNSRLDEIQAAVLRVKLPHLDQRNRGRLAAAMRYRELLDGVEGVVLPHVAADRTHVFHQYTVRIADGKRDLVREKLAERGIGTMVYYPVPVHLLPVYAGLGCRLPVTEAAAREVLSLPIGPLIEREAQERVAEAVRAAVR